jgi:hypothetical protein
MGVGVLGKDLQAFQELALGLVELPFGKLGLPLLQLNAAKRMHLLMFMITLLETSPFSY